MAGIDYLRAMADGELPQPPIAGLMRFEIVAADPGRVVFTCVPDESAYNPIGAVHGGLVCTLLDSVTGCAIHSTLPQGKGYTSVEIKVNYLEGGPAEQRAAHRDRHRREGGIAGRLRRRRRHRCRRRGGRDGHQHAVGLRPVATSPSRYVRRVAQQILVIGAGIAGLATAVALQRRGHDVTVLEERSDTSSGAGISIWPNALGGTRPNRPRRCGPRGRRPGDRGSAALARRQVVTPSAPERFVKALGEPLVVIRRSALNDVLAGALASGTVHTGLSAAGTGRDGRRRAGHAVGLDDAGGGRGHRRRRHPLGGRPPPQRPAANRYVGYTAWRGIADCAIDPDLAGEVLGAGVEFGHVPLGPDHTYWFATERAPEGRVAPQGELAI